MAVKKASYTEELGTKICEMIEEGKSLSEICELDFMPNKTTILRWSVADNKVEFGLKYARAYRVRILAQIEERDELALMEISALSCDEIAEKYDIAVTDDKMIALYIRSDLQSRQTDRRVRLEHLGRSIGQLLQVFDPRFTTRQIPQEPTKEEFKMNSYSGETPENG